MVLPLGALFATSLAVSRLGHDSEIVAIRMAGVPLRRIFLPIFVVATIASGITFWLGESVAPWAKRESNRTIRYIWGLQSVPAIQENVFFQSEGYWFYVQKVDRSNPAYVVLRKVMIYESPPPGSYPLLITAEKATSRDNVWTLYNGVIHKLGPNGFTEYEAAFPSLHLNLKQAVQALWESQQTTEEMGFRELGNQIKIFSRTGQEVARLKVDWHFKLSLPLSCLVFALCAAPLSLRFCRFGSYAGILLGIVVMFLYWNNILLGKALGMTGVVPPFLAGWSQNIIFGLAGLIMIWLEE
jgi:lipopolysaccharide export system permease protein